MKEMQKLRKEEYQVQMKEVRERMAEAKEQMRVVQKEQRERVREMQLQQKEQRELLRDQQREIQRVRTAERSEWVHAFEAQLKKDGHVDSEGGFKFSMKENRLKINGDKKSKADLEKYKSLYERETGKSLGNDFKIEISTDGKNNRRVSVSVSDDSN